MVSVWLYRFRRAIRSAASSTSSRRRTVATDVAQSAAMVSRLGRHDQSLSFLTRSASITRMQRASILDSAIGRRLDLDRKTVRKYLREALRPYQRKPKPWKIDNWRAYLICGSAGNRAYTTP